MKLLLKNKFVSTILGTHFAYFGIAFLLPLSNFSVYITSYINLKYPSVTMHYGLFINLIFTLAHTFSSSLGGYLEIIFGFFKTTIIGFAILLFANLAFIFQQNIWLCYILSLILGIGVGIGISLLGKNIILYAPNKKGLITGILGLGVIAITSILALIGEKIINFEGYTLKENEEFYPKDIAEKTYIFFLMGEFSIPIGLILALLLIYEFKSEENQIENISIVEKEDGLMTKEEKEENISQNKQKDENNAKDIELKKQNSKQKINQVIRTWRYWKLALISFLIKISVTFMVNTGRTFGALIGINGNALQYLGILQTLAVMIVGPFLGMIIDKKGPLLILRIISISCILPSILLAFFMENNFVFIASFVIFALNITGLIVSFSPFIMEVYGIQESVILAGIINGCSRLSDVFTTVSAFVFSLVCEDTNEKIEIIVDKKCLKEKYAVMYFISGICCCFSSFLLFSEKSDKFNYEEITSKEFSFEKTNNDKESLN